MAKILIIDDSPTVVAALRLALESDGHEVEALDHFVNLPQVIRRRSPDLIFLDLEIPALPGLVCGRYVRKYQLKPICILVHSSRPEAELAQAAREISAAGYVTKGKTPSELREIVRNALRENGETVWAIPT